MNETQALKHTDVKVQSIVFQLDETRTEMEGIC